MQSPQVVAEEDLMEQIAFGAFLATAFVTSFAAGSGPPPRAGFGAGIGMDPIMAPGDCQMPQWR